MGNTIFLPFGAVVEQARCTERLMACLAPSPGFRRLDQSISLASLKTWLRKGGIGEGFCAIKRRVLVCLEQI
jgi:hypothetical protein